MKKFYLASFIFVLILSFGSVNASNKITSISMDIYINDSGDANVTEVWECRATEKTEWYHTYKNIGKSEIKNLTVTDENGNMYETLPSWDVDKDFYGKKNKCGINYINRGYEVCFGISEYSKNKKYTVKYDITKFVAQINDAQIVYWTLLDFSQDISSAYIKIHSDFRYKDMLDVWGFGNYGGTCHVYDGYIEMQSNGRLKSNEYMTILVKFPENTYDIANNFYEKNFNEYLSMAQEGSTKYRGSTITNFFDKFCEGISVFGGILIILVLPLGHFMNSIDWYKITTKEERKEVAKYHEYYRDIPCNKDIFMAYFISYQYSISKKEEVLWGAMFLKWIKEKRMTVQDTPNGDKKNLVLHDIDKEFENSAEENLFRIVIEASKDGILEPKEFEKWATKNYYNFRYYCERVSDVVKYKLLHNGTIEKNKEKYTHLEKLKEEALKLKGLKNYLKDYTKIADRGAIEVELFEEYLMYAQIFGIAKKVRKDFEKLYPDMIEQTVIKSYNDLDYIWHVSNRAVTRAQSARSSARAMSYSSDGGGFSSGGGGFSSGGGGGGSFGGGRRRLKIVNYLIM